MSTTSPDPTATVVEPTERVPIEGPLRSLLLWFMPGTLGIFILWGAIPTVLLPLQVEQLDPVNKVANLAVVTTIGALAAMIAQPVAGTISDRTRSRFGSRAPFIIGGALIGGLALVALGLSNTILLVALCWVLVQVSFNIVQGPFSAMLPDRVPESVRGTFAAMIGAMTMVGSLGGAILASLLSASIPGAYLVLAGTSVPTLSCCCPSCRQLRCRHSCSPSPSRAPGQTVSGGANPSCSRRHSSWGSRSSYRGSGRPSRA